MSRNLTQAMADLMDPDQWTRCAGVTRIDAIACPHCGERFPPEAVQATGDGLYYCGPCRKPFVLKRVDTPVGKAWQTSQTSEEAMNANARLQAVRRELQRGHSRCSFEVVLVERSAVTIRDLGQGRSVTNDAEQVVAELRRAGLLVPGRRLYYYDTAGDLDEIVWMEDGGVAFRPGPGRRP